MKSTVVFDALLQNYFKVVVFFIILHVAFIASYYKKTTYWETKWNIWRDYMIYLKKYILFCFHM